MAAARAVSGARARGGGVWEALTFDRLITGPVIHLVYWSGLGVVVIGAFSVVGAAIGVALREGSWAATLAALPVLVVGLLVVGAAGLVWRAVCEFYVAIFRIGDDLAALRRSVELQAAEDAAPPAASPAPATEPPLMEPPLMAPAAPPFGTATEAGAYQTRGRKR